MVDNETHLVWWLDGDGNTRGGRLRLGFIERDCRGGQVPVDLSAD
jgi:hypothetical protein